MLATGHIYHIFNRGVNKGNIFFEEGDYKRFIRVAVHYLTSKRTFSHSGLIKTGSDTGSPKSDPVSEIEKKVQVLAYCLMPNHFHFLIKQIAHKGITWYMQHLGNSYSHYVHTKHKRVGPLFEGRFKNVLVQSDEQFIHVSRYIHLNPLVSGLVSGLDDYNWSSYLRYVNDIEDSLCDPEPVLALFKSKEDYKQFVLDQADYGRELEKIKHSTIDLE